MQVEGPAFGSPEVRHTVSAANLTAGSVGRAACQRQAASRDLVKQPAWQRSTAVPVLAHHSPWTSPLRSSSLLWWYMNGLPQFDALWNLWALSKEVQASLRSTDSAIVCNRLGLRYRSLSRQAMSLYRMSAGVYTVHNCSQPCS